MPNRIRLDGLDELKNDLRNLPHELEGEADHHVTAAGNAAGFAIKSAYGAHRLTGELQDSVVVEHQHVPFGARSVVKVTSKLAYIFENGSEARHYVTVKGNKHTTGRMPPFRAAIPVFVLERRSMYERLKDVLIRNGLQVSGDA